MRAILRLRQSKSSEYSCLSKSLLYLKLSVWPAHFLPPVGVEPPNATEPESWNVARLHRNRRRAGESSEAPAVARRRRATASRPESPPVVRGGQGGLAAASAGARDGDRWRPRPVRRHRRCRRSLRPGAARAGEEAHRGPVLDLQDAGDAVAAAERARLEPRRGARLGAGRQNDQFR